MKSRRILSFLVCLCSFAPAGRAQEYPLHKRVTVKYDGLPLAVALRDLGDKAGVRFACDEALVANADHVTWEGRGVEAGRVATRILRPRGLRLERCDGADLRIVRLDPLEAYRLRRDGACAFAAKPAVTRAGDRVTIAFAVQSWCDATVAIEDRHGRIVRHLASGLLGENAPEPFQWNSRAQKLIWDGKDDRNVYVDNLEGVTVRVSLGLQPRFEKTLFWSPHKRLSEGTPLFRATPDGLYVYQGQAHDHVILFDRQGRYVRTVYPFPRGKLDRVQGLNWHTFAQTGERAPLKGGYHQAGLLTSGSNNDPGSHVEGQAAFAMAARGDRLALVHLKVNRLAADGSSGGLPLEGPVTTLPLTPGKWGGGGAVRAVSPWSAELSPDGKKLYLAGYAWTYWDTSRWGCRSCVMVMDYERGDQPTLFAGSRDEEETGSGPGQFHCATSVACDAGGRVYVSDYMNDRVQVFAPDGKFLQAIAVDKPAVVRVHQKTGDIYVFSWVVHNVAMTKADAWKAVRPRLIHLGPAEAPSRKAEYPLPLPMHGNWWAKHPAGPMYWGEIDSWSEPVTIWIATLRGSAVERGIGGGGDGFGNYGTWEQAGIKGFVAQDGRLIPVRDFGKETAAAIVRATPPILSRQRLSVNPATGKLYIAEGDSGVMKSVNQLVEVTPDSGRIALVDLPLGAEDLCFDLNGLLYLRTDTVVARYDPRSWREVPWDYGEERQGHSYGMGARGADLASALVTPGHRSFNFWHLGGMDVTAPGQLVVTTCNGAGMDSFKPATYGTVFGQGARKDGYSTGKPYAPAVYPGRMRWGEIHAWDAHGKLAREDAAPGMGHLNGLAADRDGGLYMLAAAQVRLAGQPLDPALPRDCSGTLVKMTPGRARVLSTSGNIPVPLPSESRPGRAADLDGYTCGWVEGAEWLYGGVGFSTPGACVCWNCRFDMDYFNRSFVPETLLCSVAVLDANGNLLARVGRCGNVDDGRPLDPAGGPAEARSIGGDELSLFHACYVATHTDRRLFIADAGNDRIASVKLGYQVEERVAAKSAP